MGKIRDNRGAPAAAEFLDLAPGEWLRKVPGRETFAWPLAEKPLLAVKRFGGGGHPADHWRDRWYARLRGQGRRSPAQIEFENLETLARHGFAVPRAVDWAEDLSRGLSVVLMAWIEHRETLRERLERASSPEQRRGLLEGLADFVARLHREGFYHRDLYVHHFVLGGSPASPDLTLLDLGRVRRERSPRARWLIKDLGAISHSLPSQVSEPEREAFFGRYFELAGPATLTARRRWLRAVEDRRTRIAAHVPRHSGEQPQ